MFSFNKSGLRKDNHIEMLYEKKIQLFVGKRLEEDLPERDKKILKLLKEAQMFDPRYKNVFYPTKKMAQTAIKIADKLDALTDEEFLISSYPYMWRKEIDIGKTGRAINKDAAEALEDIVIDNDLWKQK